MPEPGLGVGAETGMETKPCTRCKETQPLGQFTPDRRKRSGLASECKACGTRRKAERYRREPAFRARCVEYGAAYRKTERGSLVTERAELRCRLRKARKATTRDRLRQRIAELDRRIAAVRAGRERGREAA